MTPPPTAWEALKALPAAEITVWLCIPALFFGGLGVFSIYCALRGMPRSPRLDSISNNRLIPRLILEYGYVCLFGLPVRALVALGVTADMVSYSSLVSAVAGAYFFGRGLFSLGGWLFYISFILDALDGMVARARGSSSARGEFLDALLDRYVDFAVALGMMWYYRDEPVPLALGALGMIGTSVMGYARAKGEACGIDPNVGYMQRHERAVILGSASVLSPIVAAITEPGVAHPHHWLVVIAMGIVALFSNVTAIWRARYVMARIAQPPKPSPEPVREQAAVVGGRGQERLA
jgi:phosphatidylglycerophosphate synthase